MEIKSAYYTAHIGHKMYEIPKDHLEELIDEFAINAKFYMSSDESTEATTKINQAVVKELKDRFKLLPLSLVAEAYHRGAVGELGGTTRFTFRNIYTWLKAIEEKSQRLFQEEISQKDARRRAEEENAFRARQKKSNMYGAAFYRKIEWCQAGLVTSKQYDYLTLDRIVAMMERGHDIKNLRPEHIL